MGSERRIADHVVVPESVEVLTPRQVAAVVGRHEATVTAALRSGELAGRQRVEGGRWFVTRAAAFEWVFGEAA